MQKVHSICLVIDSDYPFTEHYAKQRNRWKKYMGLDPEIKCYFVRLKADINEDIAVDESNFTIYVRGVESYTPGILTKTLKAMQYIYNTFDFNFLIRTNLSSFWNFNLYKKVFNKPTENTVKASIGLLYGIQFPEGAGMVLSKDIIYKMINNQNSFDYKENDDVAIGMFLHNFNISISDAQNDRFLFTRGLPLNELLSKIHSNIDKKYMFRVIYDRNKQDEFVSDTLLSLAYQIQ
jgi:hypothetical protein